MPTATHDGIELHYDVTGAGPPVVLLHSFLCSGTMWAGQVPSLSEQYRVINIDARGHGRSSGIERPFSFYSAVGDVTAVLDALGIERAVWAGLSMGGFTALRAALTIPNRVAGLMLLDTGAGGEPAPARLKYSAMAWVVRILGIRPMVRPICRIMLGATTRRTRPDLVGRWSRALERVDVPSALRTLDALKTRDDLSGRLREIDVPALVVVGSEDVGRPPREARALAEGLTNATYVEIPKAGHLSALERPAQVTEAMLRFLRSECATARGTG